jgi:hypothetical protein
MVAFDHLASPFKSKCQLKAEGECHAQLSGGRAATSSARPGSFLEGGGAGRGEGKFTCCKHSRKKTRVNSTGAHIARGSKNTNSRLIRIMTGYGTKSRAPKLDMPAVSKKSRTAVTAGRGNIHRVRTTLISRRTTAWAMHPLWAKSGLSGARRAHPCGGQERTSYTPVGALAMSPLGHKRTLRARPLCACLVLKATNRSAKKPAVRSQMTKTSTADNGGDADLGGPRNSAKAPSPSQ